MYWREGRGKEDGWDGVWGYDREGWLVYFCSS